jgi:hypothetical protein
MRLWGSICAFSNGDAANMLAKLANARRRLTLNRHWFSITPMKPPEIDESGHCTRSFARSLCYTGD